MRHMRIQIQRWLRQPEVWRFVGFASSVIGLLCYALSSSFNHLFGEWNLLKIFLYSIFSFIISLMILFAKVWQHSMSLRFKAHLAFLVLALTSAYSFFFDKAVNGKPDAYTPISCAAFAVMSLSLSRQIHCGFEVDLLYFFLGCLIVQLMKLKLLLGIVGAGFSYSLIILRSSLDVPPQTGYLGLQDHVIIQVNSQQTNTSDSAIQVIDSQQTNISDSALIMPQLMACIEALKKKNRELIRVLHNHVDENVELDYRQLLQTDHNLSIDALPSEIINDLQETVKLTVAGGFEEECCHVYSNWRREFLQEYLSKLGLAEPNIEDIDNMERTERWIKASEIAFGILFPNERRLCDRVFFGFPSAAHLSFNEVCRELITRLQNITNTFALGSHLPSLLLANLSVFEILRVLIVPELESLFPDQYSVSLRNEAITTSKRLSEAIKGIFMELENHVIGDTAQAAVPGGGIHPITLRVVDCFRHVIVYKIIVDPIFGENRMVPEREGTSSSLRVQMARIIELLESNLEAKSKNYTDPALGYLFLINNHRCIQGLGRLFGSDWLQKQVTKLQQNRERYQRSSWDMVLDFLKLDGNDSVAPNVAAKSMKEKLNLFNIHFKEICSDQSTWIISDRKLREGVRRSLEIILLPAYENFIERFRDVLGKHADEYIQYGIFQIRNQLNHLFTGNKRKEKESVGI